MVDKTVKVGVKLTTEGGEKSQRAVRGTREEIEKTSAAQTKATGAQDAYNKRDKAIYQGNLASAKSFSKLSQTIGAGSSGLVGAYATLAANVFAATAAFNALRSAAQIDQLSKSLEFLGNAAGRDLTLVSKKLQEVTGYAISSADAMRAASFGFSAGFSTEQLESLAKIAKGASGALGRDLTDSYDRLIRGVAKLEPEILDELGIIVKLDKATQDYAVSLGKNVDDLSAFERTQAFANATISQGTQKYGALADVLEANPYDKLAASLSNFVVQASKLVMILNPVIESMSQSFASLLGVITVFTSGFARQLLPSLYKLPEAMARFSEATLINSAKLAENIGTNVKASDAYKKTISAIQEGNYSSEVFTAGQEQLARSIRATEASIKKSKAFRDMPMDVNSAAEKVQTYTNKISKLTAEQQKVDGKLNDTKAALQSYKASLSQTEIGTEAYNKKVAQSEARIAALTAKKKELNRQIGGTKAALTTFNNSLIDAQNGAAGLNTKIANQEEAVKNLRNEQANLSRLQAAAAAQTAKNQVSTGLATLATENYFIGLRDTVVGLGNLTRAQVAAAAGGTGFAKSMAIVKASATAAVGAINILATSLLRFLPYIGLLLAFGPPLIDWFKNKFMPEDEMEKKTKIMGEAQVNLANFITQLDKSDKQFKLNFETPGIDRTNAAITALIGTMSSLRTLVSDTRDSFVSMFKELELSAVSADIEQSQAEINRLNEAINRGGFTKNELQGKRPLVDLSEVVPFSEKDIQNANDEITRLSIAIVEKRQTAIQNAEDRANEANKKFFEKNRKNVLDQVSGSELFKDLEKSIGGVEVGGVFVTLRDRLNSEFDTLLEGVTANTNTEDLMVGLETYLRAIATGRETIRSAGAAADKAIQQAVAKNPTEFSEIISRLREVVGVVRNIDEAQERVVRTGEDAEIFANAQKLLPILEAAEDSLLNTKNRVEGLNKEAERLDRLGTVESLVAAEEKRSLAIKAQIDGIDTQIAAYTAMGDSQSRVDQLTIERGVLEDELNDTFQKRITLAEREAAERQGILDIQNKIFSSTQAIVNANQSIARSEREIAALRDLGREDTALTAAEELDLFKEFKKERLALISTEFSLKLATIDIEYDLLEYRAKILQEEQRAKGQSTESVSRLITSIRQARELSIEAATKEANAALGQLNVEGERLRRATIDAGKAASPTQAIATSTIGLGGFDAEAYASNIATAGKNAMAGARAQYTDLKTGGLEPGVTENFIKMEGAITSANAAAQPFFESLRSLGPDGQLAAAIGQSTLIMADSFNTLATAGTSAADKLAAVGAMIGAIGQIQQASSQQSIAAIDKQIEAERKRDGKSQESLSKIASLEKKKEQEKKKAFEQNKKMLMAQTVISTAAAIMNTMASPALVPPSNFIVAAMVGALGAAQLAIIASSSYQGGGSSGSASVPKTIQAGERSNKVDIAQRPAGGELAYIQGARGMGTNANNFTPAFMGAKYRATGGYVVGEQGPELFLPDVPGTIVPSDETRQMSAPVNVTFSVSAIDASSFNDMLADQRGNIISLIREAANLSGEPFLESVNTIPMSPTQRTYYRKA